MRIAPADNEGRLLGDWKEASVSPWELGLCYHAEWGEQDLAKEGIVTFAHTDAGEVVELIPAPINLFSTAGLLVWYYKASAR